MRSNPEAVYFRNGALHVTSSLLHSSQGQLLRHLSQTYGQGTLFPELLWMKVLSRMTYGLVEDDQRHFKVHYINQQTKGHCQSPWQMVKALFGSHGTLTIKRQQFGPGVIIGYLIKAMEFHTKPP